MSLQAAKGNMGSLSAYVHRTNEQVALARPEFRRVGKVLQHLPSAFKPIPMRREGPRAEFGCVNLSVI
jgi:hypothetical protein